MIIGNLTRDPELRSTTTGKTVCSFTVAVNRRQSSQQRQNGQQPEADFFNVSAWNERGEICAKYLSKGRKVCVMGPVSCRSYTRSDGTAGASLEVTADEVEFLSAKSDGDNYNQSAPAGGNEPGPSSGQTKTNPEQVSMTQVDSRSGMQVVNDPELPF